MSCSCGIIRVGGEPTESRNWSLDCEEHGLESEWYKSELQVSKRRIASERLRALQAEAKRRKEGGAKNPNFFKELDKCQDT